MYLCSRIIMDVDDVISVHKNRDYENAVPNLPVIEKMRKLSRMGISFVLFTARGQISCHGNIEKIEKEKRPILQAWLKKYDVPYEELRFGKPIGDVYVDDGAMTPDEFLDGKFQVLKGGSNEYVEQLGKFVVKEYKHINSNDVREWYDKATDNGYYVPFTYANTYNKLRMEHIKGPTANTIPYNKRNNIINRIANTIISFAGVQGNYIFDVEEYKDYIKNNVFDKDSKRFVDIACRKIEAVSDSICPSFCHGDLTSSNVIVNNNNLYMIDPVPHVYFSSFMMDLAKLRMSVNGQNELFYSNSLALDGIKYLVDLDTMLYRLGWLRVVETLEFTCWVRLIKYKYNNSREYDVLLKRLEGLVEMGGF